MCLIVDASVVGEMFGGDDSSAGKAILDWLNDRKGTIVVGGKLLKELSRGSNKFTEWARQALLREVMRRVEDTKVDRRTKQLIKDGNCKSNDPHVIALAQLGGARLLYSNDGDLQQDFKNRTLINKPKGRVHSTKKNKSITPGLRRLLQLQKKDLCGVPQ